MEEAVVQRVVGCLAEGASDSLGQAVSRLLRPHPGPNATGHEILGNRHLLVCEPVRPWSENGAGVVEVDPVIRAEAAEFLSH